MKISIKNNLRLSEVPPKLRDELIERFKFPNPKWIENNRMGRWNRGVPKVLKFYDKIRDNGLWIPRGYIRQLIWLCRRYGIDYQVDDQRCFLPKVSYRFSGELKPFQQKAVDVMLSREFGTLSSPTGSGKTVMALYMVAKRDQPALIVVHTKDLAFQWIERIEAFFNIPGKAVGLIGCGKKNIGDAITVALVQSLYKCADEVSNHIGFLVVDECHRCPSRTFTEAVTSFNSRYMLGLSATPWRRDNLSKLIFWHLGDVHYEVDKTRLVENGDVLSAEIFIRETDFQSCFDPVNEYSKMLSELTVNDDRNRLIVSDVAQESLYNNGTCLVLSDRKRHCETLQAMLKYTYRIESELLTGNLTLSERQKVLSRLGQGKLKVLIATGQLIGEGVDSKNLSSLFLATPIKFSGRLIQYMGRVLRPAHGKKKAKVYDYVDIKVEVLRISAKARQKVYQRQPDCV